MIGKYAKGNIRPTKAIDFEYLDKHLRWSDRLEFESLNYGEIQFVPYMTYALKHTPMLTAITNEGGVVFVMGYNLISTPKGEASGAFVWLVGTHLMDSITYEIARNTKAFLNEIRKDYSFLRTHAIAFEPKRNRWLKWMGFKEVSRVEARGKLQLPFIDYELL